MNAPLRRGHCPTLAAPMATGDGLLARLNPVASGFSPKALIKLCKAALRHGNGIVEVTARGSLQIRGLTARSAGLLAAEVDALGIEVRAGVPVETGLLAGLDPDELADPRPLAERVRRGVAAAGLSERLGPKVSVVVDGGGHSGLDAVSADVRLKAARDGADILWQVAIAGDAATATAVCCFDEGAACAAALVVLGAIAAIGREARARDLPAVFVKRILPEVQPSMLPAKERQVSRRREIFERILPLRNGRFAAMAALPFGHDRADQLIDFLQQSQALDVAEIRLAPGRSLILLCPSEGAAIAVREAAKWAGLIVDTRDPRARIAACPGAPACASGHIHARAIAAEVAAATPDGLAPSLHVSGCEKRCAKPGHNGLTLLGFSEGAGLVLESAERTPLAVVAKEQAVDAIGRVIGLVAAERKAGESEADCLARIGKDQLAQTFRQEP